jgi:acyl-CoA reductase-like NAD-dependent aldehyde dehydrogenase
MLLILYYTHTHTHTHNEMQAAAEFITPVSLELGGKTPTIIDESVGDLELVGAICQYGNNRRR